MILNFDVTVWVFFFPKLQAWPPVVSRCCKAICVALPVLTYLVSFVLFHCSSQQCYLQETYRELNWQSQVYFILFKQNSSWPNCSSKNFLKIQLQQKPMRLVSGESNYCKQIFLFFKVFDPTDFCLNTLAADVLLMRTKYTLGKWSQFNLVVWVKGGQAGELLQFLK